jgi:dienelactone hydrolase
VLAVALALPAAAFSQGASAEEPLGKEAALAVLRFFDYDTGIPLDARVLATSQTPACQRETIVLTGGQGDRVPGVLAIPRTGTPPYPVVLAMHAGASSKEGWWRDDSFERGASLTRQLLAAGIAVVALDAQYQGERSARNDYLSLRELYFEKKWFARYRDSLIETTKDYRRALDYLATRPEIDARRTGVIGYSMGGLMAVYLSAVEPRVRVTVACSAALSEPWLYPLSPINLSSGIRGKALLVLAGRSDSLISVQATQRFFDAVEGSPKELGFFDSDHQLPAEYGDRALLFFTRHLK